ncbi:MAG: GGDEF domain-containing protein [Caulobacterales bacterium]|nr:GGDEF domain-containing protein [Caulobacterales bacterium]
MSRPLAHPSSTDQTDGATAIEAGLPAAARPVLDILSGDGGRSVGRVPRQSVISLIHEVDRLRAEASELRERVRELEGLADADPLTPVLNHRAFVRELSRLLCLASRYGLRPGLVYVDLDRFKSLNDTHGHAFGDEALRHIGRILKESVRSTDLVGRMGGDEFAVALADGGLSVAQAKADQFGKALAQFPVVHEDVAITISASIGAVAIEPGENAKEALQRADEAMYHVKRARRDGDAVRD